MIVFSALFCAVLVVFQNVLPVCCVISGRAPRNNFDNVDTLERHVDTLESQNHQDDTRGMGESYSTPSTPRPEDVDCYVEIPTTVRVGGTCIRYRENAFFWLCQSGVNAQVSPECGRRAQQSHQRYRYAQQSSLRRMRRRTRRHASP